MKVPSLGFSMPALRRKMPKLRLARPAKTEVFLTTAPEAPFLKTYMESKNSRADRRLRAFGLTALLVFCLFQGLLFAFFAPYLIPMFTIVPAILLGLVIWALPAHDSPPIRMMTVTFAGFFLSLLLWPNYLAVALPGLPWITLIRLTNFPMVFALAVALSQSASFRRDLGETLNATPLIWKLMCAFLVIQLVTLPFSSYLSTSIQRLIVAYTTWFAVYFVSVYVFRTPGRITYWALGLIGMMIILGVLGLAEYHYRHVLWADHIPSFLKIEDPSVIAILKGGGRMYTNIYRVQTTFSTALGFGEFIALVLPFVFHFIAWEYKPAVRFAAIGVAVFITYVALLSGSRSATIGELVGAMLTVGAWGAMRWRRDSRSLLGPATVIAYPAGGVLVLAASMYVGRLRNALWGGGETVSSNQARTDQWTMGLHRLAENPFGHGIATAGQVLGFHLLSGLLVIDSYFLSLLLDYGVIGFIVFVGLILATIVYAAKAAYDGGLSDPEARFLPPLAISLSTWLIIKAVNAEESNHPIVFMMLGMVTALIYRNKILSKAASRS